MGPARKKSKTSPHPNVEEGGKNAQLTPEASTADNASSHLSSAEDEAPRPLVMEIKPDTISTKQLNPKSSWYGTWPRKSVASTQVARETILANKPVNGSSTADLSRFETKQPPSTPGRPPSMYVGKGKETADVTMGGTLEEEDVSSKELNPATSALPAGDPKTEPTKESEVSNSPPELQSQIHTEINTSQSLRPGTASGWLGWLGKPAQSSSDTNMSEDSASKTKETLPPDSLPPREAPEPLNINVEETLSNSPGLSAPSTSWFGLWSTAAPSTVTEPAKKQIPSKKGDTAMVESKESGELAVAGESSQNHPEPAKIVTMKEDKNTKKSKRGRPQSTEVDEASRKAAQLEPSKVATSQDPSPSTTLKTFPPNLLIPSVKSTYRLVDNPSILQQITRLILHGQQQQPVKHVSLVKEAPKIRKALAIGIHGLFPAPLLRTVIGQPTGTSIRFANHAADAIRRWTDSHGAIECEIEKVALEGEGKIGERVDNLWKLLLNWIDHIRTADFIMVACHSQGVPVAVMLVAKLIEFGVVSSAKIGICAMAGVSLGPFADYKSRLFSGSAGELFEFADPESVVSKRYEDSLRVSVKYGSSIFSPVSHPYIYRAVFVDGRIHAPDFIAHLVGFALKLRNLGVSDHGLIRELSAPLAGSLYTGEGHSRLYDDQNVYDLAIEHTLETTSVGDIPLQIKKYEIPTNANPYVLPWIMRGLLEEDFVKTELDSETAELLKQFDAWKPATKVLKDVKYRLEAVRSKL
ncbi:hypothetical protein B7494_g6581 [Chlorociboria aeruginascens]|nr:hypothetical protein B7494_g6581 [Chlorociboria aeruginascens]